VSHLGRDDTVDALAAHRVVKRYGTTTALRGVDLTVRPGELVGLLGPNGAGKSTLVKAACGLVRISDGSLEVCGQPAGSRPARERVGYLAEIFRFPGWATAGEVLRLHQRLAGSPGGPGEVERLLDLVGLGAEDRRRVDTMSKGMQQRLGIAQALVGDPQLVLLDEPTSALDPVGRRLVRELLSELRRRGVGVLLNSHLLTEVELVCDRVAIIVGGEVVRRGRPEELVGAPIVEVETDRQVRRFPGLGRDGVPSLVARLVAAGESVYAVRTVARSLEDVYLEAVGGAAGGGSGGDG
jgi:ABC-2 type transport system ATP-binding protein